METATARAAFAAHKIPARNKWFSFQVMKNKTLQVASRIGAAHTSTRYRRAEPLADFDVCEGARDVRLPLHYTSFVVM